MYISPHDLDRWKKNSINMALKLGFDKNTLEFIDKHVKLTNINTFPPPGMLYGWCKYDKKNPLIEVYYRNLSTETSEVMQFAMKSRKLPDKLIEEIMYVHNQIGTNNFFEIYNQSGMDHELIGHLYNFLLEKNHDEKAAVSIQILFAQKRSGIIFGKNWRRILKIMPKILGYHKNIDELK